MKFSSFAAFFAPLLLVVHSKEVESQESSFFLRQGRHGDDVNPSLSLSSPQGEKVNAVSLQKINHDFEDATPPSNHHRLLAADSFWQQVNSFPPGAYMGGNRVSISGDGTFLAAAPYNSKGIVEFFQKQDGGTWEESNTDLRLEGDGPYDYFGSAVSLSNDGKRVAIGAYRDDGDSGSVSVYDIDDAGKWKEPQVIHGENANDGSGWSVALSKDGKTLAIGAPAIISNAHGHVKVYREDDVGDNLFKQIGDDIDGAAAGERFGNSVALSADGSVLAVGAPYAKNEYGARAGIVRVYELDGNWTQRGSDIVGDNDFGDSVDLSDDGNILAVGAQNGKYVKAFEWKVVSWQPIDNAAFENLNGVGAVISVSLATLSSSDSTILAVGTETTAYTYKLSEAGVGNQTWEKLADEIPGAQVSLSSNGKTLAVGDPYGNGNATVYNFKTPAPASGSNGDPHFRTWNGGHFEYHGQCDMILVKDENFADGLGLQVQIRTKL
eukprot:scaffold4174_cov66-Cylindrotheca_fusiformis.AAC.1